MASDSTDKGVGLALLAGTYNCAGCASVFGSMAATTAPSDKNKDVLCVPSRSERLTFFSRQRKPKLSRASIASSKVQGPGRRATLARRAAADMGLSRPSSSQSTQPSIGSLGPGSAA